jgi:hypothetical protein
MADTIRTLAQLNTQFADNTVGICSPQDIRDLMVSLMVHGEIGSLAKSAITLAAGFQPLDFNQAGAVGRGLTIDTANKWIDGISVNMKAEITLEVSFQGANNTTFEFAVFRNPDGTPEQITRLTDNERIFSAAMVGGIKISSALQLNAGDKLQAGVRPVAGTPSFTLLRGLLRVRRIAIE